MAAEDTLVEFYKRELDRRDAETAEFLDRYERTFAVASSLDRSPSPRFHLCALAGPASRVAAVEPSQEEVIRQRRAARAREAQVAELQATASEASVALLVGFVRLTGFPLLLRDEEVSPKERKTKKSLV